MVEAGRRRQAADPGAGRQGQCLVRACGRWRAGTDLPCLVDLRPGAVGCRWRWSTVSPSDHRLPLRDGPRATSSPWSGPGGGRNWASSSARARRCRPCKGCRWCGLRQDRHSDRGQAGADELSLRLARRGMRSCRSWRRSRRRPEHRRRRHCAAAEGMVLLNGGSWRSPAMASRRGSRARKSRWGPRERWAIGVWKIAAFLPEVELAADRGESPIYAARDGK